MHDKAVDTHPSTIKCVPDRFKTQEMCNKLLIDVLLCLILFPIDIKLKKCVIKLSLMILLRLNIVMIDIRLKKCVIKPVFKICS